MTNKALPEYVNMEYTVENCMFGTDETKFLLDVFVKPASGTRSQGDDTILGAGEQQCGESDQKLRVERRRDAGHNINW